MEEVTGILDNWSWDNILNVYWGDISEDTRGRFVDGTRIHTSHVPFKEDRNKQEGNCIIRTLNSRYFLGKKRTS